LLAPFDGRDLNPDIFLAADGNMVITDLAWFLCKKLDAADTRCILFRYNGLYQERRLLFCRGYLMNRPAYAALDACLAGLCKDRMILLTPAFRTIYPHLHHQQPVYV
jgi:hypothetical protein